MTWAMRRKEVAVVAEPAESPALVENSRTDSQTAANFLASESQQLHTEITKQCPSEVRW